MENTYSAFILEKQYQQKFQNQYHHHHRLYKGDKHVITNS